MPRDILNVTVKLDHIHCFDESDGAGDAEPYLWTVFFRVDGSNTFVNSQLKVTSTPTIWTTPGSHGNLGTNDVDAGQDVPIPNALGLYKSTLLPIAIPSIDSDASGLIGCVCVLMEEDNVSDAGAEAGHQALNTAVRDAVTKIANTGTGISDEEIQKLVDGISTTVSQAVQNQQGFFANLWAGLDPDDTLGAKVFIFTHDDLAKKGTIPFDQRWTGSDGDWQIFGNATATVLCPASAFSKSSSSSATGGSATDSARVEESLSVMRDFREREWNQRPGLWAWWTLAERHVSELALAASRDPQVLDAATQLLTAMPDILGRRDQPLPPEFLRNAEIVLQSLRTSGSRKARLDASRAVWALRQLGEKSFDQAVELLAANRPARHPRAR